MSPDVYLTIAAPVSFEIPKIKGSRFIGEAQPATDSLEALAFIEAVRKREHAASHCCFAYRLTPDGSMFRSSDAGEPAGSAGRPILQEIDGRSLTDLVVVVARYFGGTRLGIGGLVRAYGKTAAAVLDQASIRERVRMRQLVIQHSYDVTSAVLRTLARFSVTIVDQRYAEQTKLVVDIAASLADALSDAVRDATSGKARIHFAEESYS